ncbi:MAG: PEP-CTERM sorting domain-containing protein [Rhodoferax sp.]|nr:PEP-CTERM sorting domain-containing protein [Rhodoferax sp.]
MPATEGSLEQYITTRTSASIYDSVQFSGTNSFSGALQITFMGSLRTSDYVDFTNTKSSMTWAQISHLSNIGGLFSSDAIAIASDCQGTPEPGCVVAKSTRTEFLIPFTVTNTARELSFQITLATQSFLDSEADFGHSAYLRLTGVPDDVTFTSGSGQFLLNPVAIPAVPEPEAFAMLLAGVGLIGLKLRRRSGRVPSLTR